MVWSNLIQIKRPSVEKGCLNNNLEACRNWVACLHFSTPRSANRHVCETNLVSLRCWGVLVLLVLRWDVQDGEKWMTKITELLLCGFFRNSVVRFVYVQLFLDSSVPLHHKCHWCFSSWLPAISSFHNCFLWTDRRRLPTSCCYPVDKLTVNVWFWLFVAVLYVSREWCRQVLFHLKDELKSLHAVSS